MVAVGTGPGTLTIFWRRSTQKFQLGVDICSVPIGSHSIQRRATGLAVGVGIPGDTHHRY